jgi:3-deoxy-D-arabino-heptulosonate 7-phosphate (DAHP) synthase class II
MENNSWRINKKTLFLSLENLNISDIIKKINRIKSSLEMKRMGISPSNPYFFPEDIESVLERFKEILEGKAFLLQSKYCGEHEKKFSNYCDKRFGVTTSNGTSSLGLILISNNNI